MSKHYQLVEDLEINLEELIACYEQFRESKGFSTDNPDNIDFNAICINRKPGDPNQSLVVISVESIGPILTIQVPRNKDLKKSKKKNTPKFVQNLKARILRLFTII